MSRSSEFLQYADYNNSLKSINCAKDAQVRAIAEQQAFALKQQIKKMYVLNETTFRTWFNANQEFLKVLTKGEKQDLKYLQEQFEATDKVTDLAKILDFLNDANYTDFINQYMEDYCQEVI